MSNTTKQMRQFKLSRQEGDTTHLMTTWLEDDPRLKAGVSLTLKGDKTLWKVTKAFDLVVSMSEIDHRGWDNNNYDKHEGLRLK